VEALDVTITGHDVMDFGLFGALEPNFHDIQRPCREEL
jgi:hypothetical protein